MGHRDKIRTLSVFPNQNIVSGSSDGSVRVWNPNDGKLVKVYSNIGNILCTQVFSNGNLAIGTYNEISIRDSDGDIFRTILIDRLRYFAIHPKAYLISLSEDRIQIWNPNDGSLVREFIGYY